jgi:hypothetical protein
MTTYDEAMLDANPLDDMSNADSLSKITFLIVSVTV